MHPVIEKLLNDLDDPREGIQANVFVSGVALGGAVRRSEIEGFYELLTLVPGQGDETKMVLYYIDPKAIDAVAVPVDGSNGGSGIILPGMEH